MDMSKKIESPKRGRWTPEEREMFEKLLRKHGKEWKKISEILQTRTVVQVRTHAQKYFKKLAKQTGTSVLSTSKKQGLHLPFTADQIGATKSQHLQLQAPSAANNFAGVLHPGSVTNANIHNNNDASRYQPRTRAQRRASGSGGTAAALGLTGSDQSLDASSSELPGLKTIELPSSLSSSNLSTGEGENGNKQGGQGRRRSRRMSRRWSTITPRTMAAATILAAPNIRKNSEDTDLLEGKLTWAVATLSEETEKRQREKSGSKNKGSQRTRKRKSRK